ncbi:hypothetical protein NP493_792g00000 [Ridgeia piscesae]|uniref:Endoglucanase n=1 Tax=Ridgeia piscesae TaxID=27915 RepID=A0AAD9KN14_RIDPI|nr:hypothetical protein NP493_792g00000 [Ridgeia piscesae]
MVSVQSVLVGSVLLLAFARNSAVAENNFCSKVSDDWSTMKEKIESLKSESEAVAQLNTNLQSLSSRMNDLEAKVAACNCGSNGDGGATEPTKKTTTTKAPSGTTVTVPPHTGSVPDTGTFNLSEVLHLSNLFYEAQRSGDLPDNNRVPWRHDSALGDKGNNGEDLTGGWYDAGDYVKFGLPMAYSVTMLSWGLIEYRDAYQAAGELAYGLDCIKWPLDYFIKAHVGKNKFYGQVGDGNADHSFWGRPEDMDMARPAFLLDESHGGTEVAAETAAAMAAASIVFRPTDPGYADTLLRHARELYDFGYKFQRKYTESISNAKDFYQSFSGFKDELAWGALWLHKATGEKAYLDKAEEFLHNGVAWALSWDDKTVGAQLLYYMATNDAQYKAAVEGFLNAWFPGGNVPKTPKGLAFRNDWGSLRYAANSAFLALVAADKGIHVSKGRAFAKTQLEYMLGSTGRSFVVGFGTNPPVQPHHRAASCSADPSVPCSMSDKDKAGPNPNILYGALVGGPNGNDQYIDRRSDFTANEVATDYNAGFQSAIAGAISTL